MKVDKTGGESSLLPARGPSFKLTTAHVGHPLNLVIVILRLHDYISYSTYLLYFSCTKHNT